MHSDRADERELFEPVNLCNERGHLASNAIGWSRFPLHRCNLRGHFFRKKRWDYWCVSTQSHLLSLVYADLGYLGIAEVAWLDYASGRYAKKSAAVPLALGFQQPEQVAGASIHFRGQGLELDIWEHPSGTRLEALVGRVGRARLRAELFAKLPRGDETLNVVVPWSTSRFQFTSKHVARPTTGWALVDGERWNFGADNEAFACLDFGRGVWPFSTTWNWAAASGMVEGRRVGINLGGQWTDGTGSTENALFIDGKIHKISEPVTFDYDPTSDRAPWVIRDAGNKIHLVLEPFYPRRENVNLGILHSRVIQCFGRMSGHVRVGSQRLDLRGLIGWAEEHQARW